MALSERELYLAATSALVSGNPEQLEQVVRELRNGLATKIAKPKTHPVAGEEYKTCAEYWAEGQEPPKSVTKRTPMSQLGDYTTILVTFTDDTTVRAGSFDVDKAGNPELTNAIRWARTVRFGYERRRKIASIKRLRTELAQSYRQADSKQERARLNRKVGPLLAKLDALRVGEWVQTPTNWRRVPKLLPIPAIKSVEVIDPATEEPMRSAA